MKSFQPITYDAVQARIELKQFSDHLEANPTLKERKDVLKFFSDRPQLSALIGILNPSNGRADFIAREFPVFGDFVADLAIKDSKTDAVTIVEFENADETSIFVKGKRDYPIWSPRFEKGFSQIVDWLWKMNQLEQIVDYEQKFGTRVPSIYALLVLGRDRHLVDGSTESHRFKWRREKTVIESRHVACYTFDELLALIEGKLEFYANHGRAP